MKNYILGAGLELSAGPVPVRATAYAPAVARFAIRAPSVEDLLDPYSVEPLERRPLRDDVREQILYAWIDTREERPSHLTVLLPADEAREGIDRRLESAIRHDLEATYEESRTLHVFSPGERRQALIAFAFLVLTLVASSLIDKATNDSAFVEGISQGLVVLGWVALWRPAEQVFYAVSRRLSRKRYRELSEVPIEITWAEA